LWADYEDDASVMAVVGREKQIDVMKVLQGSWCAPPFPSFQAYLHKGNAEANRAGQQADSILAKLSRSGVRADIIVHIERP
jgi:hypothetical protein